MIVRLFALGLLGWMLGFVWFAIFLPEPLDGRPTDAIVVLTGGPGRIDRARHDLAQRLGQFVAQQSEVALDAAIPADQHMVGAGNAMIRQQFARQNAKTALHPVADDSAANLLRDRDAIAHRRIAVTALAHQQDKARHRRAPPSIRRPKIRAPDHDGRRGRHFRR